MPTNEPSAKQLRWRRNKAAQRARKAQVQPPAPTPEFVAQAHADARSRVRAAVMPETVPLLFRIARLLREDGAPFDAADLFSIWYDYRHDPTRPNLDVWRLSDSARDFTIDVWTAKTIIEHQLGPGKATAGRIARHLAEHGLGRAYTKGSLRVMVWRALDRIERIEAAEQLVKDPDTSPRDDP